MILILLLGSSLWYCWDAALWTLLTKGEETANIQVTVKMHIGMANNVDEDEVTIFIFEFKFILYYIYIKRIVTI